MSRSNRPASVIANRVRPRAEQSDQGVWTPQNSQLSYAYKRLVRMIHQQDLHEGDRLPSQSELRALLGVSNNTLTPVMRSLVQDGVLKRKTRVGTVVADRSALPRVPWSLGVATIPSSTHQPGAFYAELNLRVQVHIARMGYRCLPYYRLGETHQAYASSFPLLKTDLEAGLLDGLLVTINADLGFWHRMEEQGVAMVHAPTWSDAPCGAIIDYPAMVNHAVGLLKEQGCKRPALAAMHPIDKQPDFVSKAYIKALATHRLDKHKHQVLAGGQSIEGGRNVAEQWRALPARQRPDAFVVVDDYIALGLTEGLAGESNPPHIAVAVSDELPMNYHLPVFRYRINLEAVAEQAVDRLLQRLLHPDQTQGAQWLPVQLPEGPPRHSP